MSLAVAPLYGSLETFSFQHKHGIRFEVSTRGLKGGTWKTVPNHLAESSGKFGVTAESFVNLCKSEASTGAKCSLTSTWPHSNSPELM